MYHSVGDSLAKGLIRRDLHTNVNPVPSILRSWVTFVSKTSTQQVRSQFYERAMS
jgi:hypothetical protein